MLYPPLLRRGEVAEYQAHNQGQQSIWNRPKQRWVDCIRTCGLSISSIRYRNSSSSRPLAAIACQGHDIAGNAKQADGCQPEESRNACVKSDKRRLPKQFCQHRNRIVRIVVVVDRIAG